MDDGRPTDAVTPVVVELTAYDAVIFDFDGPMCNLFAGRPAATVARELKRRLVEGGWPAKALPTTTDPHQILRLVAEQMPDMTSIIDAALAAAEVAAVDSAIETPGLANLLARLEDSGMALAIASNNNAGAIRRWLRQQGHSVEHVIGRDPTDPASMKPSPAVLLAALGLLGIDPQQALFIGDAATDATAAGDAGCDFVAYANKPHKLGVFRRLDCLAIITDLDQLSVERPALAPRD